MSGRTRTAPPTVYRDNLPEGARLAPSGEGARALARMIWGRLCEASDEAPPAAQPATDTPARVR